jgi:hypothetical protein
MVSVATRHKRVLPASRLPCLLSCSLLIISLAITSVYAIPEVESEALLAILDHWPVLGQATTGNPWNASDLSNACSWNFVQCSAEPSVTALQFSFANLGGTIPTVIGALKNLTSFTFSACKLDRQPFPEWVISELPRLTFLSLANTNLTGTIPRSIGSMPKIASLILSNNQLSSTIPAEIGNLTTIKNLYLYTNRLTGPIPDLSNLTKLDQLQLQENFLTGTIPSFFTTLPVLSQFNVFNNWLSGSIPEGFGSMEKLWIFQVYSNRLNGSLPSDLGSGKIQFLFLHNNTLSGSIPSDYFKNNVVTWLRMEYNYFNGSLPASLANLTAAVYQSFHFNFFTGAIPGGMRNSSPLFMDHNYLDLCHPPADLPTRGRYGPQYVTPNCVCPAAYPDPQDDCSVDSCVGEAPGVYFYCSSGVWKTIRPIIKDSLIVGPAPVQIGGDLNTTHLVISSPSANLTIDGCWVGGDDDDGSGGGGGGKMVTIFLTPEQVESLINSTSNGNESATIEQMLLLQNSSCITDLDKINLLVETNGGNPCWTTKVLPSSKTDETTKTTSLIALFSVTQNPGCGSPFGSLSPEEAAKKSKTWWIIVVSVLGGVILIVAIIALLLTFHKPSQTALRPFLARKTIRATTTTKD